MSIIFYNWRLLLTLRRAIHLQKYCGMMRRPNIYFQFIIALELLGENERWSLWSMVHMEDCSLGLLHSFWFCHTFVIVIVHADDKRNITR